MTIQLEDRITASASTLDQAIDAYAGRESRRSRRRLTTSAASVVLVVAGVASIAALGARETERGVADPASTATTVSPPTSTADPVASPEGPEQARLRAYAVPLLLDSGETRDEMVAFLSLNVPEDEVRSCMEDAGFGYTPGPSPQEEVDADVRFTLTPHDYAAEYGLGIAGWELGLMPPLPEEGAPAPGGGDAAAGALAGCRGIFDPEGRATSDAVNVAVGMFRVNVDADPRTVAALAEWRACMAPAGFDYASPRAMRESFYGRIGTDEAADAIFADEVTTAIANVPCEAAYVAVVRTVIDDRFGEFTAMFDTALANGLSPAAQG